MSLSLTRVYNPNPGWYRGDFHTHSTCSDGSLTPIQLSQLADSLKLDFLAITDHNDLRAFDDFDPSFECMILPGIEVTLLQGHFNIFGFAGNTAETQELLRGIVDIPTNMKYLLSWEHDKLEALLERLSVAGYFISLNHPLLEPWEWRDALMDVGWFDGIELVNDPTYSDNYHKNPAALRMWSAWLNLGYRTTGLGGSDFHSQTPFDNPGRRSSPDLPLTYVYAPELSCQGILDGIRRRNVFISMGPEVALELEVGGQAYIMGDDAGMQTAPGILHARVSGCEGNARMIAVRNGKELANNIVRDGVGEMEIPVPVSDAPQRRWYRLDVLDAAGQVLAVSNPIFVGPRRPPPPTPFGNIAAKIGRS